MYQNAGSRVVTRIHNRAISTFNLVLALWGVSLEIQGLGQQPLGITKMKFSAYLSANKSSCASQQHIFIFGEAFQGLMSRSNLSSQS